MRERRRGSHVRKAVALGALAALVGRDAWAFLDSGTLLTNSASATYMGGGQGTSVTYSATAKILVANPAMFLWKDVLAATNGINPLGWGVVPVLGGLVTYRICFSNGGANTAFNVTINDRLPNNSYWQAAGYEAWGIQTTGAGVGLTDSYNVSGAWVSGPPPNGQQSPASGLFLRWVLPGGLGIGKSGCIVFTLSLG